MKKFFVGTLLLLLLAVSVPSVKAEASDSRKIAKGVFIGPVEVSGMGVTEAEDAVTSYVNEIEKQTIVLSAGPDRQMEITGQDIGLYWSNTGVVEDAYALGHEGNIIKRYKELKDLERNNHTFDLVYGYDEAAITEYVAKCAESFDQETINYTLKKTADGFQITDGQTGYLVDQAQSVGLIESFIRDGLGGADNIVDLSVKADEPKGSAEELARVKDVLGTFTTSYKSSGAARSANVANGCSLINGATVYPGEEFSVLDTITPFTEANGYFPAGSYLNGLVVESVGGGICQVSTTLYNAVLLAELEVTERHNHSMIVNYVSPSADAAIAESGGKNFRFVNNQESPIYIEGYTTSDKHITFTIYGVETRPAGRTVTYDSKVLETTPASADQFVTDPSQGIGYVGVQSAHLGYKAQLWKTVTENGQSTTEQVNSSTYKMVPKIVTVGTAGADEGAMASLQAAINTGDVATVKSVAGALGAARAAAGTEGAEAANQAVTDAVNAANAQLQQQAQPPAPEEGDNAEVITTG